MIERLPRYEFSGTPDEMGFQHGSQCKTLIERHIELLTERFTQLDIAMSSAAERALVYRQHVRAVAPEFDEELGGLARGAGISLGTAYLLQLRAEIHADFMDDVDASNECTTFAFEPDATMQGGSLVGQNADLPAMYRELLFVAEFRSDVGPAVLMVVPAGQISYIGINDRGMAAFANFLRCDGWRAGFPRYLYTRLALSQPDVSAATALISTIFRASSRNLLLLGDGAAVDIENTPSAVALIEPVAGRLFHANHYVAPELLDDERSEGVRLLNSQIRFDRITELSDPVRGPVSIGRVAEIMRDRHDPLNALSVEFGDAPEFGEYMTVCGVIAEPDHGRLWVSAGPPSQHAYFAESFSGAPTPTHTL